MHHGLRKNAFTFLLAVPMTDIKPGVVILGLNDLFFFRSNTEMFSNQRNTRAMFFTCCPRLFGGNWVGKSQPAISGQSLIRFRQCIDRQPHLLVQVGTAFVLKLRHSTQLLQQIESQSLKYSLPLNLEKKCTIHFHFHETHFRRVVCFFHNQFLMTMHGYQSRKNHWIHSPL